MAPSYRLGLVAVVCSSFFTSLAGFFVRSLEEADGWTLQVYRMASFLACIGAVLLWRYGGQIGPAFRMIGRQGVVGALCLSVAFSCFLFALLETTVAQVIFIGSTSPLFAALLAYLILGERLPLVTWCAMAAAAGGIALMVASGLEGGSLLGTGLAVVTMMGYGSFLVATRARPGIDMLPSVILTGLIVLTISLVMAPTLAISRHDLVIAILFGVVQLGLQYVLIAFGARAVPAGEVAFFARLQIVLGPLWVWLAFSEVPSMLTLAGGAIVLAAVLVNSLARLRLSRAAPQG
jgi:drug/metabolite transporter (DMT)-like permease